LDWIEDRAEILLRQSPSPVPTNGGEPSRGQFESVLPGLHYGVGDIHVMRAELDRLLELIEADANLLAREATVVFLGELVNRGPARAWTQ
jgi:hypothetical protein